jgi:dsDNA-specific endonuclease/ATPase MutS2
MEDSLFLALESSNLYEIDLHGSDNVSDALDLLDSSLYSAYKNKEKYCRIICGIGKGILKKEVLKSIKNNPMIKDFREGESGGDIIVEI